MSTVQAAEEAAEDAVISSIRAGLESYATEKMMSEGRRYWPGDPFDALATAPSGYTGDDADGDPDTDGEWTYKPTSENSADGIIFHQRNDNSIWEWAYNSANVAGGGLGDDTGTLASDGTKTSDVD
jgi:hypothetical protein